MFLWGKTQKKHPGLSGGPFAYGSRPASSTHCIPRGHGWFANIRSRYSPRLTPWKMQNCVYSWSVVCIYIQHWVRFTELNCIIRFVVSTLISKFTSSRCLVTSTFGIRWGGQCCGHVLNCWGSDSLVQIIRYLLQSQINLGVHVFFVNTTLHYVKTYMHARLDNTI